MANTTNEERRARLASQGHLLSSLGKIRLDHETEDMAHIVHLLAQVIQSYRNDPSERTVAIKILFRRVTEDE